LIIGLPLLRMTPGIYSCGSEFFDFAGPLVQRRPVQACERRNVKVAFNDVANEGRLTMAVGTRQVELAATIHSAIAVIISLALE
jgi:hypothetical protein